jgi:FkbM family methyltransferase
MTVLDIGANIGYYALLEASLEGTKKVYALEPDPRNITLLEKNVRLNGFGDRIQIYPYAVSDKNGTETFYLGERSNVSSFVKRGDVVGQAEVKCITLDDFEHIQEVDFIRMDVEGYEVPILRGARNFLTKTKKPIKIIMELHNKAYDKGNFNMNEQLEYLFQNDFYTRYIISAAAEKHEHIFSEKGYTPTQQAYENDTIRNLYKHITPGHSLSFLESGSIRAILLEKKVS